MDNFKGDLKETIANWFLFCTVLQCSFCDNAFQFILTNCKKNQLDFSRFFKRNTFIEIDLIRKSIQNLTKQENLVEKLINI